MRVIALLLIVIILVGLIFYAATLTIKHRELKRLLEGLEKPELWLPRRERRAHARKLLRREDDEYTQKIIERTTLHLKGEL